VAEPQRLCRRNWYDNLVRESCVQPTWRVGGRAPALLLVTVARNRAVDLAAAAAGVVAQTFMPARWVIVDDGSTDHTAEAAEALARRYPWVRVVRRPAGTTGGDTAFREGVHAAGSGGFDFVCRHEADVALPAGYFARLLEEFAADPGLGVASGECLAVLEGRPCPEPAGAAPLPAAARVYRRICFSMTERFAVADPADGVDCHHLAALGWRVSCFPDARLAVGRTTPVAGGLLRHGRRHASRGRGLYQLGAGPVYAARAAWAAGAGGPALVAGYLAAWLTGRTRWGDSHTRQRLRRHLWDVLATPVPAVMPAGVLNS
jgi:biofilm PGA synthesis N-glycosyltransferase PgaC